PFGPRNPKISPGRTVNSIPRTASTSPKVLLRPSTSTAGPPSGMGLPPVGAYAPSPARGGRRRETTRGRHGRSAHRDGGLQAPAGLVVAAQDQAGHGRVRPDRRGDHVRAARRPPGVEGGRAPAGRTRPPRDRRRRAAAPPRPRPARVRPRRRSRAGRTAAAPRPRPRPAPPRAGARAAAPPPARRPCPPDRRTPP